MNRISNKNLSELLEDGSVGSRLQEVKDHFLGIQTSIKVDQSLPRLSAPKSTISRNYYGNQQQLSPPKHIRLNRGTYFPKSLPTLLSQVEPQRLLVADADTAISSSSSNLARMQSIRLTSPGTQSIGTATRRPGSGRPPIEDLIKLKDVFEKKIVSISSDYDGKIKSLKVERDALISRLKIVLGSEKVTSKQQEEIVAVSSEYNMKIIEMRQERDATVAKLKHDIDAEQIENRKMRECLQEMKKHHEELERKIHETEQQTIARETNLKAAALSAARNEILEQLAAESSAWKASQNVLDNSSTNAPKSNKTTTSDSSQDSDKGTAALLQSLEVERQENLKLHEELRRQKILRMSEEKESEIFR